MNYSEVKFTLNLNGYEDSTIRDVFKKAGSILNWRFDENLNARLIDNDIDYHITDVSNLERESIDQIIDSFFDFTFDNIVNVALYKFLVLKDSEKTS